MSNFKKIEYYNLREEMLAGKLPNVIGRKEEMERLTRVISRRINNNVIIVGQSGIGKTMTVYGWIKYLSQHEQYQSLGFIQFDSEHLYDFDNDEQRESFVEPFAKLPPCVAFIDNFGRVVHNNVFLLRKLSRLYDALLKSLEVRMVLTLEPQELVWLEKEYPTFVQLFEIITIKNQPSFEYVQILENKLSYLNKQHRIIVPTASLQEIVSYVERFPSLGQLPKSAISLLDESIAYSFFMKQKVLTDETIAHVVSSKISIPKSQLNKNEMDALKNLEQILNSRIVGQTKAVAKITGNLQRARLGIRNPQKPLGSFLILGPSGVGKTETAKLVAETMFGQSESFVRFDMSEFSQDHTIQRLIGSPAGYVGHEDGGALTNSLKKEPHCLILLDEIEKAHPKVFDIFLQVLDDGRLTSGKNETVDACHSIIMATSNIGVEEIIKEFEFGGDVMNESFIQEKIIPSLAKTFRLEFLNRFDSILIFNPLTLPSLVQIAQLEIKKIEKRMVKHKVHFDIDETALEDKIKLLVDPRFGARPVKRFIEETCESLVAQSLLNKVK